MIILGSNTTLIIEVSGLDNLYNVTNIVLTTLNGDWLSTYPAGNAIGRDRRLYKCHVMVPNQVLFQSNVRQLTTGYQGMISSISGASLDGGFMKAKPS